jgi:hypothetical protein
VLSTVQLLVKSIGLDPAHYGTHSLRIGGATALFAAGASETVIRTMGRWSSDCFRIYVRACVGQCADWSRRAGSAAPELVVGLQDFDEVDDY